MLWDIIRDFFVEHIFGGYNSLGESFSASLGTLLNSNEEGANANTINTFVKVDMDFFDLTEGYHLDYMSLGDWLSTTATIISISIIVVLCCLFVYKIIKLIGGLIR